MESWNAAVNSLLYRPLKGELPLRLLRLGAGLPGQPIECELVPTSLGAAAEQYEATSYTWGSPANPQAILCNGASMLIQKNAFDMLNGLRWADEPRTIWIDAICIDQSNVDERAAQVSMMSDIYRRAKNVVVWLGPPDEDSKVAMEHARTLDSAALIREHVATTDESELLQASALRNKTYHFDEPHQEDGFRAHALSILRFLQRPWFNRVWVQQEASLCWHTRVYCGADWVEWDQIFALAWAMHPRQTGGYPAYIQDALGNVFYNLSAIVEIERFRNRIFTEQYGTNRTSIYLLHTLETARRFGATDPRDKVFALQNLATDADQWVKVDYRVPWQVVYLEIGRICLESGWMSFLEAAGKTRHLPGSVLPSWAPDYRGVSDCESTIKEQHFWMPGGGIPGLPIKLSQAIGAVYPLPKRHRRRLTLPEEIKGYKGAQKQLLQSYASVRCIMSDEIIYLSRVLDEMYAEGNANTDGTNMHVRIIEDDLRHLETAVPQTYLNDESASDAYKLTIIFGSDEMDNAVGADFVQDNWDSWIRWLKSGSPEEWEGELKPPVFHGSYRASRMSDQFRFAVTRHGYFCLVPRLAELHDEVAIFPGYQLCTVIRPWYPSPTGRLASMNGAEETSVPPRPQEAEYHEFIGDAYIHGMMRNEAQCITVEFGCKHKPSESQWNKILRESDEGNGEGWQTLGFSGNYSRILSTLGDRRVKLV